jgi:multicomponent Na+:H+ antiporter subunit D
LYVVGIVLDTVETDEADEADETGETGEQADKPREESPTGSVDATTFGGRAITTGQPPAAMLAPTIGLVAFGLAFTVLAGPLSTLTERVAGELTARTPYVVAVTGR